jgi:hypothetical protein
MPEMIHGGAPEAFLPSFTRKSEYSPYGLYHAMYNLTKIKKIRFMFSIDTITPHVLKLT